MNKIEQAYNLMNDHEYDQAINILKQALPEANDDEKFVISQIYLNWGFNDEAEQILKQLNLQYPNETEITLSLAQIYIDQEQDEAALSLLMDIKEDDPHYIHALVQIADLYQAQGLGEAAVAKLLEAKQLSPDEVVIDFALGELLFSMGKYARAITFYERVLNETEELNEVSIHLRLAEAYAGDGQYEKSLVFYNTVDDDQPDTMFKHGLTAYYANEHQIAVQQWNELLNHDKYYHSAYIYLVQAYKDEGNLPKALEIATDGLHIDAYNKELYFLAGQLSYELGIEEEGINYVQEAIALDPEYKEAVLYLVNYHRENSGDELIIELLEDLKEMGVNDPLYDWELAKSYVEMELYDKALHHYDELYSLMSHDEQFLKEYAYFLVEEGKVKEAIHVFKQYLKLVQDDDEIILYVERLMENDY